MENWESLRQECLQCQNCSLAAHRTHVVFGTGAENAKILLVGEGPGKHEDEQGVPFVGRAGALLDDMLAIIGLNREKVYIANTVKCRPPENRDPFNEEKMACRSWLNRQIALLQPKILICLGRHAAKELIREDFQISNEHGQWFEKDGVRMTAIFHPAALLRDDGKGPETFEDLKEIQRIIRQVCPEVLEGWTPGAF